MQNKELEVRTLFEKMLKDTDEYARTYEDYAKDMKNFNATVQWKFGPVKGYQIFQGPEYSFKNDAEIENPLMTIACDDLNVAKRFLRDKFDDMRDLLKEDFEISSPYAPVLDDPNLLAKIGFNQGLATLGVVVKLVEKIPPFRPILERTEGVGHSTAVAIPINQSVGTYNNEMLSIGVVEYFINKASHIFLYDVCPCREVRNCQNHDHYKFSCMLLGRGVLKIKPDLPGHRATKEEALERLRGAVADGLVPGFGRLRSDAINRIGGPIPDTGDLFNLCYCCPCCCVIGNVKDSPSYLRQVFKKLEGLTVTVDRDLCTDCGKCVEVCIYGAMEMVDDKMVMDPEKCFGCGRCERVCPSGAITITLEEGSVEKMIARIEAQIDVT